MTRLTQLILGTRDDIHVEATPAAPHAFWITLGENHQPLLNSEPVYPSASAALDAGWDVVNECKKSLSGGGMMNALQGEA